MKDTPYRFEWIVPGDPVEGTEQYRQAVAMHAGLRLGSRLADVDRDRALYCVGQNDSEERPPGRYLLFIGADVVVVDAYKQREQRADGTLTVTFRIDSWTIPRQLQGDEKMVRAAVIEALEASGFTGPLPVASVFVVFRAGL